MNQRFKYIEECAQKLYDLAKEKYGYPRDPEYPSKSVLDTYFRELDLDSLLSLQEQQILKTLVVGLAKKDYYKKKYDLRL